MIDFKKLARQRKFIDNWVKGGCKGTLEAVTGFGKTYVGILTIKEMLKRHSDYTTLVVVPTKYLQEQWQQRIKKHRLQNVRVKVINTAIKSPGRCELLILDEIHNYAATTFIKVFSTIRYSFILGLTATIERQDNRHNLIQNFCPVLDSVDLKEAVNEGYISKYNTYNLAVEMEEDDWKELKKLNDKFHFFFSRFDHDFELAMQCLKDPTPRRAIAKRYDVDDSTVQGYAIQFSRLMQKRKQFLYTHPKKRQIALDIMENLQVKTITFCENVEFAKELKRAQPDISVEYHSRMSKSGKKEALQRFNDGRTKIRVVHTAKSLDEGFDAANVELGIITSGTSSKRQDTQRTGRVTRYLEGKQATVINLYMKDTQEEKWLKNRQKGKENVTNVESSEKLYEYLFGGKSEPGDPISAGSYQLVR